MDMKLAECFPTKWSAFIFIMYMTLFINQGILVTATKDKNAKYNYSTTTVVMLTEFIKLCICITVYLKELSVVKLIRDIAANSKVLLLYFIPAFLYSLYNNLAFINLAVFDPTTYYLLLQFRVVVTGTLFQILFKKKLSGKQWMSLILLTAGCIVKQMHTPQSPSSSSNEHIDKKSVDPGGFISFHLNFHLFLILVQVFCSCFAGVYNEYLLKDAGAEIHLMVQNVFMYIDSIICNFVVILLNGEAQTAFSASSLQSVFQPLVIAVMVNGAGCGIVTSMFLKNLNSILKTFASALELVFTAVLCWIIFGIPIDIFTVAAIGIVSYATYLYSQNPVVNKGRLDKIADNKNTDTLPLNSGDQDV